MSVYIFSDLLSLLCSLLYFKKVKPTFTTGESWRFCDCADYWYSKLALFQFHIKYSSRMTRSTIIYSGFYLTCITVSEIKAFDTIVKVSDRRYSCRSNTFILTKPKMTLIKTELTWIRSRVYNYFPYRSYLFT